MKLIDNRYRVDEVLENSVYGSIFKATDFWDDDKKLFMKLYNIEKQQNIIYYFIENFITLSNIRHKFLLTSNRFDIINTIDRKKVSIKQYYATTEYISAPSLDEVYTKLSLEDRLYIILQLCTVLDFLHHRGFVYKYLSPSNIYVLEDKSIKLKDLATIYEITINKHYDDLTRYFMAPEVLMEQDDIIDKNADKYSLGMIIVYLFMKDFYNFDESNIDYIDCFKLEDKQMKFLNSIIKNLTKTSPNTRDYSLMKLIKDINDLFSLDYEYDLLEERGTLNFKTKIVGREKEINTIFSIDDNIFHNKCSSKLILVKGDAGSGKTRFLKEINHLLKMKGRDVYYTEVSDIGNTPLKPIENLLRKMVKDTSAYIMSKYGKELARILPELRYMLDIDLYNDVGEDREMLRLYDRITSYLEEFSKDRLIYLMIDDLDNSDIETLLLLDYMLKFLDKSNIVLILAFDENKISSSSDKEDIIKQWSKQQEVEEIKMSNLGLHEVGEFIQYILGISYKPLKFSATILKESQGNPRNIEYMMKDLYATGEIYLSSKGCWDVKAKRYSDIYFSSNVDETLSKQVLNMGKKHKDIIKIMSIYNSSVSKNTLLNILNMDRNELDKNLKQLVDMGLIDERVGDWGYSYSINNAQLKRFIYHQISKEERVALHKKSVRLLEDNYSKDYKPILDELIHHLIYSNQKEKALEYLVREAEQSNIYSSQSIFLWEGAYDIANTLETEYKFKILKNLGESYFLRGENQKALDMYEQLLKHGQEHDDIEHIVLAKIGIGGIYLKRNFMELAQKEAQEAMIISKEKNYINGFIKSSILYNRVLLERGKFEYVKSNMEKLLEISINNKIDEYLGDIYNIMGLSQYYLGNMEGAISNYKKSIKSFQQVKNFVDSTKPMNNIANIYVQYGKISDAMKYYEEGLNIAERYGALDSKLIFLNNIGSIYIMTHDYEKSKSYIEEARTTSIEIEEINLEVLTNINLGTIHLFTGDYEQSYNYYMMLKEKYSSNEKFRYEINGYYYNFLGEFYYTFGKWEEALKYSNMSIEICKEFGTVEYILSKIRIVIIKYFMEGIYDKNAIEEIRKELKSMRLSYDRRDGLLKIAIIPFWEGDYEYTKEILKEDRELREKYSAPILDYKNDILFYGMEKHELSIEKLLEAEKNMKKHNLPHIDVYTNILLGFKFAKYGKPYQSINYLLEALDLMYNLIKNVPNRELQIGYIRMHKGDDIKFKMTEIIEKVFGVNIDCIYLSNMKPNQSIEKYFDYGFLIELFNDEDFNKIMSFNHYHYSDIKDISSIETLMLNLTSNYENNLKLILKYIGRETLAQRGYILIYDEGKSKYLPIVSVDDNINWIPNENLLSLANRYERGVLINNSKELNIVGLYKEFLPKDIKALICIPIVATQKKNSFLEKERRKKKWNITQRVEGYIYLETDRIFNRFDKKRHKLANCLSQLLYINIENYKLKVLSTIDKLTGTYTRKYFENEFNRIFDEARRNNESFAVLMLDIDRFKNVNDTYGHRKGDEVLNIIGKCLINNVRNTDIVARYGGEEFIIILRNVEQKEAMAIGEKIRANIEKIKVYPIKETITISIGISQFPKHSQFKEELIEKADQALYRAKEKGRNRVEVWEAHLTNTLNRVDKLAGILSGNINQDQRNVLALLDVIDLVKVDKKKEEKIFEFLGRLIETIEGEYASLLLLDEEIIYSRSKLNQEWVDNPFINYNIVNRVIANKKGEFLIDWDSLDDKDLMLRTPNWQSIIVLPLEFEGEIKGIVYISVPLKEKEFDYNSYNMARALCGIFSIVI